MRKKYLKIGICFIAVSIFLFDAMSTQTKVNINRLPSVDIVYACDRINGIGEITAQELIKNAPYDNLEVVSMLPNIGEKKSKIINQHFTTHDTVRIQIYVFCLLMAIVCAFAGSYLAKFYVESIKKDQKRFDDAFGLKTLKRK
jgi:hypothetical protein